MNVKYGSVANLTRWGRSVSNVIAETKQLLDGVNRGLEETRRVILLAEKRIADCRELLARTQTVWPALVNLRSSG